MKKIIISTLISIISLLVLSTIASLIISFLQFSNGIKVNTYIIQLISVVIFFISGFLFGLINKKQGLLGAICFILVYLIFILIFDVFINSHQVDRFYFLFIIAKCLAYSLATIVSVNIKSH